MAIWGFWEANLYLRDINMGNREVTLGLSEAMCRLRQAVLGLREAAQVFRGGPLGPIWVAWGLR